MAIDSRRARRVIRTHRDDVNVTRLVTPRSEVSPITAAAQLLTVGYEDNPNRYESWQDEAWDFYENLGEFNYGVEWFGQALSRVRLNAAEITPGGDEPKPLKSGPATEIIEQLGGGPDGVAQLMKAFGTQLSVPGDSWLVGRQVGERDVMDGLILDAVPDTSGNVWTVQPYGTVRQARWTWQNFGGRQRRGWELQVDDTRWVKLPQESLISRVWNRNQRLPWRATSPARAALPIMREIDMYNRHIMASLVSRVALNGMLLIPEEVTLPSNPTYEDAANPFVAELIDIMRRAIKNPGSPSAALPMPLRVPSALIESFRHLTFSTPLEEKIWTARDGAVKRLATTLNLPAEILTGMGEVNHWGAWQLDESAIKVHIIPTVEIITRCLTIGYLHPLLQAGGEQTITSGGNRIIVWYDTSELAQRPDRSALATQLSDAILISDTAARRETGFDEADKPSDEESKNMLLRKLVLGGGQLAGPAYEKLTGEELSPPPVQAPVAGVPGSTSSGPETSGGGTSSAGQPSSPTPATGAPPDRSTEPAPEEMTGARAPVGAVSK